MRRYEPVVRGGRCEPSDNGEELCESLNETDVDGLFGIILIYI